MDFLLFEAQDADAARLRGWTWGIDAAAVAAATRSDRASMIA
jgi:hypothetical protein